MNLWRRKKKMLWKFVLFVVKRKSEMENFRKIEIQKNNNCSLCEDFSLPFFIT